MTKYTEIVLVLDRSGSMSSVRLDTIGGLNTFLAEQRKVKGKAVLTLAQFDDEYELMYRGMDIQDIPDFTEETFVPRGLTALLDAVGRTINDLYSRHKSMKKKDRPEQVIFVIMTDGGENASLEFNREAIFKMIREMEEKDKWQFVFLGANQDAIDAGKSLGVSFGSSLNYSAGATADTYGVMSSAISNYRSTGEMKAFSDDDRDKAMGEDEEKENK